jgi:hypothetical protein
VIIKEYILQKQQTQTAAPERHFIFGYGSLINSISRSVTGETGSAQAVKISGFTRHWSRISEDFGMSSVVVVPDTQGACNGVIVEVNPAEFESFDLRERGYQRVLVSLEQIEFYDSHTDLNANDMSVDKCAIKIWLYQTDKVVVPCENHPVVFSYLDVILSGCLEYSEQFCNDFISLTKGWHYAMLNDRQTPRYPRVQSDLDTQLLNPYIQLNSPLSKAAISPGYC